MQGESEELVEQMAQIKEENNQLYFELRNEYDNEGQSLQKQTE